MEHMATKKVRLNLAIRGKRTSLALEAGVWDSLTEMCRKEETSLDELCEDIVAQSKGVSMASAIRIAVLEHFAERAAAAKS